MNLKEAPESDELEFIQSISIATFQRAETDKINGREHGELDIRPEEEGEKDDGRKEKDEENPTNLTKREEDEEESEKEEEADTVKERDYEPREESERIQEIDHKVFRHQTEPLFWSTDNNIPFFQGVPPSAV